LVVLDRFGQQHRNEDATLRLRMRIGGLWQTDQITVQAGRWSIRGPVGEDLEVLDLIAGGRPAFLAEQGIVVAADRSEECQLSIYARWPRPSMLRVVDGATGADLTDIEIAYTGPASRYPSRFPGRTLSRAATSPVDLDALVRQPLSRSSPIAYWARAPDYAWGRILVDHRRARSRILPLQRGYCLTIHLHDHDRALPQRSARLPGMMINSADHLPAPEPVLALRPMASGDHRVDPEPILVTRPAADGPSLMTGIPPGRYDLSLDSGRATSLGRTVVEILDRDQTADLCIEPRAAEQPVAFFGTISLPEEWGRLDGRLQVSCADRHRPFVLIRPAQMRREGTSLYHWHAGELPPGPYQLQLGAYGFRAPVDHRAPGTTGYDIEIPPPAEISVRVVHGEHERAVPGARLYWQSDPAQRRGVRVPAGDNLGELTFTAPAGRLILTVEAPATRFASQRQELTARPGPNHLLISLRPRCGLDLRLLDGEVEIPWDETRYSLRLIGPDTGQTHQATPPLVSLPGPGQYEVHFGSFAGYRPVAPQRIVVQHGEFTGLEVRLRRNY